MSFGQLADPARRRAQDSGPVGGVGQMQDGAHGRVVDRPCDADGAQFPTGVECAHQANQREQREQVVGFQSL
ncbi:MAG: hypothetical protein F4Y86_06530 [Gammaproteobacteria bacterium]|nr:hypothetical protein [Gammaproteobacteria bacterium]